MILAEIDNNTIGVIVQSATALLMLVFVAMQVFRGASGHESERQIEPTELHAIRTEQRAQTSTLNTINREVGEVKTQVAAIAADVTGLHQRVSGISREVAATMARVDGLEKRENT